MPVFGRPVLAEYKRIADDDENKEEQSPETKSVQRLKVQLSWRQVLCYLVLAVTTTALGYVSGHYRLNLEIGQDLEARTTLRTFNYNLTFAKAPSPRTNAAWDELLPSNGGFIKNPTGGVERTGLSIFHQLHCLDMIRRVYYAAYLDLPPDPTIESPHKHARHCFDFLRQSIMCAGDTTIEYEDLSAKGITGIGATHRCADYDRIVAWAEGQGNGD